MHLVARAYATHTKSLNCGALNQSVTPYYSANKWVDLGVWGLGSKRYNGKCTNRMNPECCTLNSWINEFFKIAPVYSPISSLRILDCGPPIMTPYIKIPCRNERLWQPPYLYTSSTQQQDILALYSDGCLNWSHTLILVYISGGINPHFTNLRAFNTFIPAPIFGLHFDPFD